jgi:curli biogenesis system outer membrane secretion channel CsgG
MKIAKQAKAALSAQVTLVIIVIMALIGCAGTPSGPKPPATGKAAEFAAFDAVIEKSYDNLSARLRAGMRIAILPLRAADRENGNYAFDTIETIFSNALTYDMITRTKIAEIMQEQNFQYSGLVDDNTAVQFGKLLGAQAIIVGDISGVDYTRRLVFRCLDVETGRILAISSERF